MAIFLDDVLGGGINSIKAKINILTVRADLTRYGFVINEEKSLWEPVQVITWLGIPMAIFLDDVLGGGINSIKVKINILTVRADLTRYGFVITSAEREVKVSRRSGMYQSYNFLTRLGMQSL